MLVLSSSMHFLWCFEINDVLHGLVCDFCAVQWETPQGQVILPSRRLEVMGIKKNGAPRSFLCRYVQAPTTQVKPEDKFVIKKTATEACEIHTL